MATKKANSKELQAANYKANKNWETNRRKKLERTLKAQPTNEQVKAALRDIRYRRKTPGAQGWSASQIAVAKLFKQFSGKFDKAFFSADPKVSQAWLQMQSPVAANYTPLPGPKNFFALEARSNMRTK